MPELPEIALLEKYINSTSLNKKIVDMEFLQTGLYQKTRRSASLGEIFRFRPTGWQSSDCHFFRLNFGQEVSGI